MTDLSRPADGDDDAPAGTANTGDSTPDSASADALSESGTAAATAESGAATDSETNDHGDSAVGAGRARRLLGAAVTTLAGVLVLVALVAPNEVNRLTFGALLRIPVEGLLAVALLLVLPARPRRVVATLLGALLGLILVLKVTDLGFSAVLDRRFDLIADWTFLGAGAEFLSESYGAAAEVGAIVLAVVAALAVPVLVTLSARRLAGAAAAHRRVTTRAVTALAAAWVVCAVLGAQIVPGVPVAADTVAADVFDRARQVRAGLNDKETLSTQLAGDPFRDVPGEQMLTALRGKDVLFTFVESYGRVALEDPDLAPEVDAVLDEGTRQLRAAGYASRSAFLTSSTTGGGSWLAHATLMSGIRTDNQLRYTNLVRSDHLTLNGAFKRAGWRTALVMPALNRAWPEAAFFEPDTLYGAKELGYKGPLFSFSSPPDQYTLSAFQSRERGPGRAPVMAEIPLLSSHLPWTPVPPLVDWDDVGDGSVYKGTARADRSAEGTREAYQRAVVYSLRTLISYVQRYGDENLVLVFLGDHQPARAITGDGAGKDVPITVVAKDPAVLDRIAGWGWQDGLNPDPQAPVWPMESFRDRFLRAFGPQSTTHS
ncbi:MULTISPECIES: sulfatase [unclassified Micromonospora]|uniref:sulfatase n=1 Tax=unclassified Micromonospora TaxID=2617518 RepID=UPI001B364326|nr:MULTISPECIES: sulfatase [unclassified Micromonospora]MBQ1042522.1 sulfatase [Micromonospora sp. C72]MBQ1058220.1 sulfatase [Micromonospora sp. C32]